MCGEVQSSLLWDIKVTLAIEKKHCARRKKKRRRRWRNESPWTTRVQWENNISFLLSCGPLRQLAAKQVSKRVLNAKNSFNLFRDKRSRLSWGDICKLHLARERSTENVLEFFLSFHRQIAQHSLGHAFAQHLNSYAPYSRTRPPSIFVEH